MTLKVGLKHMIVQFSCSIYITMIMYTFNNTTIKTHCRSCVVFYLYHYDHVYIHIYHILHMHHAFCYPLGKHSAF